MILCTINFWTWFRSRNLGTNIIEDSVDRLCLIESRSSRRLMMVELKLIKRSFDCQKLAILRCPAGLARCIGCTTVSSYIVEAERCRLNFSRRLYCYRPIARYHYLCLKSLECPGSADDALPSLCFRDIVMSASLFSVWSWIAGRSAGSRG